MIRDDRSSNNETEDSAILLDGEANSNTRSLPDEVLLFILSFLVNGIDLLNASQVCWRWQELVRDEQLQKKIFIDTFGRLMDAAKLLQNPESYRAFYLASAQQFAQDRRELAAKETNISPKFTDIIGGVVKFGRSVVGLDAIDDTPLQLSDRQKLFSTILFGDLNALDALLINNASKPEAERLRPNGTCIIKFDSKISLFSRFEVPYTPSIFHYRLTPLRFSCWIARFSMLKYLSDKRKAPFFYPKNINFALEHGGSAPITNDYEKIKLQYTYVAAAIALVNPTKIAELLELIRYVKEHHTKVIEKEKLAILLSAIRVGLIKEINEILSDDAGNIFEKCGITYMPHLLYFAAYYGQLESFDYLLKYIVAFAELEENKIESPEQSIKEIINDMYKYHGRLIDMAAKSGSVELVKRLLELGADAFHQDDLSQILGSIACKYPSRQNSADGSQEQQSRYDEILKLLVDMANKENKKVKLQGYGNVDEKYYYLVLIKVIELGLQLDPEYRHSNGGTWLHVIKRIWRFVDIDDDDIYELTLMLIKQGFDVNALDADGKTPLRLYVSATAPLVRLVIDDPFISLLKLVSKIEDWLTKDAARKQYKTNLLNYLFDKKGFAMLKNLFNYQNSSWSFDQSQKAFVNSLIVEFAQINPDDLDAKKAREIKNRFKGKGRYVSNRLNDVVIYLDSIKYSNAECNSNKSNAYVAQVKF